MISLIFLLSCPPTKMENTSKYPWNDYDKKILTYMETRCGQVYPDAPCVKLFRKFDDQQYSVICGK